MSSFSEVFKQLRLSKGYTQDELAKALGISRSRVGMYETGARKPDFEMLETIADFYNVDLNYLLGHTSKTLRLVEVDPLLSSSASNGSLAVPNNPAYALGKYRIPIVATVAAGEPIYSEENIESWIDYDKDPRGHVFACRIKGDSMSPRIQDGDIIIVDEEAGWEDGDIILATVNGNDGTCKRFKKYADSIALLSLNPAYDPMVFTTKQVKDLPVEIKGKVVEARARF